MKTTLLNLIIFTLASHSLLGQENRTWNDIYEIYEHLDYHRNNKNEDSSIYYVDELVNFLTRNLNGNDPLKAEANSSKITVLLEFNRNEEALELTLSSLEYCIGANDSESCIPCASTYSQLSDFMILLENYEQSMTYLNMTCEEQINGMFHYKKATIYRLQERPEDALRMTEKWISIVKASKIEINLVAAYNQHGIIARELKKFDIAITSFKTAIQIAKDNNLYPEDYAYIVGNLGSCYFALKEFDKAYTYLLIDSKGSVNQRSKGSFINAELNLAEIDFKRKNYAVQIKRLTRLLENYGKNLLPVQKLAIYEILIDTYKLLGNQSAYKHYTDLWVELNKSYYQFTIDSHKKMVLKQSKSVLKRVTEKMKLEKQLKEQEFLTLKTETDKKNVTLLLLIIGLALIMCITLLLFLRYKSIQTKKAVLKENQLKLASQEQKILELKINQESKNVKALSLELMVKQNFSSKLVNELNQLETITKPEIKAIEIYIKNELNVKSARVIIQEQMGELSGDFHNAISIKHPTLTDKDLELAAMIALNMKNKEIAISKNITPASVKKTKTRLKQKLTIPYEND